MQLKIKREESSRGLIFKKKEYVVRTQLLVSEEEREAIKILDLESKTFVTPYEHDGITWGNDLVSLWADKGTGFPCDSILDATEIENEVKESAKLIKENVQAFIDSGAATETEEVFEL